MEAVPTTPSRNIAHELTHLREMRKSLGGEALQPIEIDLDIIAEAYPREGCFLLQENIHPRTNNVFHGHGAAKSTPGQSQTSSMNGFFRSEKEREFAKNLMKEFVQIHILQGVHGKEAFKSALSETRIRIYAHRGEKVPELPPAIPSPSLDDWSPRSTHASQPVEPMRTVTPRSSRSVQLPKSSQRKKPVSSEAPPMTTLTPSRVKEIVAAIQSTPKKPTQEELVNPVQKTPGSSARIKAIAECIEATIAAGTPSKRAEMKEKQKESVNPVPMEITQTHESPAVSKRRRAEPVSTKTTNKKQKVENTTSASPEEISKKPKTPTVDSSSPPSVPKEKVVASASPADKQVPSSSHIERPRRKAAIVAVETIVPEVVTRSAKKKVSSSAHVQGDISEPENVRKSTRASTKPVASTTKKPSNTALEPIVEEEHTSRPARRARKP